MHEKKAVFFNCENGCKNILQNQGGKKKEFMSNINEINESINNSSHLMRKRIGNRKLISNIANFFIYIVTNVLQNKTTISI